MWMFGFQELVYSVGHCGGLRCWAFQMVVPFVQSGHGVGRTRERACPGRAFERLAGYWLLLLLPWVALLTQWAVGQSGRRSKSLLGREVGCSGCGTLSVWPWSRVLQKTGRPRVSLVTNVMLQSRPSWLDSFDLGVWLWSGVPGGWKIA